MAATKNKNNEITSTKRSDGKKTIAIIDGYHMLHRGFYGPLKQGYIIKNHKGMYVGAVYVFAAKILKMLKSNQYWSIIVAFDVSGECWRSEIFDRYKATRKSTPEELVPQMQLAREFLTSAGISWYEKEKYEGEDVIATIAQKAIKEGLAVDIYTNDRDTYQLVDDNVSIIVQKDKKTPQKRITPEEVVQKFGVEPSQIADIKAMCGDSSDNIKGVKFLRYANAIELIKRYGNVYNIIDSVDELEGEIKDQIVEAAEHIKMNIKLTTICNDLDIGYINLDKSSPNYIGFKHFLNENNIFNLDKQLMPLYKSQLELLKQREYDYKKNIDK